MSSSKAVPSPSAIEWYCFSCHTSNYDNRSVCGYCSAPALHTLWPEPHTNVLKAISVGTIQEPNVHFLQFPGGITYRTDMIAQGNSKSRKGIPGAISKQPILSAWKHKALMMQDLITHDTTSGEYTVALECPRVYQDILLQAKNGAPSALRDIENSLQGNVTLQFGTVDKRGNHLIIRGQDAEVVRQAQDRVWIEICAGKEALPYTHFLHLPLGHLPSLQYVAAELMQQLGKEASQNEAKTRIDDAMLQRVPRLHITLLMLRLYTAREIEVVSKVMKPTQTRGIQEELVQSVGPLNAANRQLHLRNMAIMNPSAHGPSDAHVAYIACEANPMSEALKDVARATAQLLYEEGIVPLHDVPTSSENVLLHMTLINSKWRRAGGRTEGASAKRESFDMSSFYETYKSIDLGSHTPDRLDFSVLGSTTPSGAYRSLASLSLQSVSPSKR